MKHLSTKVSTTDAVPSFGGVVKQPTRVRSRARVSRVLWLQAHLYLGLFVGALLVVFGLTSSILVFWQELDEWFNPDLLMVTVPPGTEPGERGYRPLTDILAAAQQAGLRGSEVTQVYAPSSLERVAAVYLQHPSKAWQRVFVDPYRATVTGVRTYGAGKLVPDGFIDIVFQLHYALFLGETGMAVAAVCALLLILTLVTGLIVWWPLTKQWRQAFAIRRPVTPTRLLFDLHKTFSLYPCLVLGAVLLSGVYMNMADPFVWVTQLFSPETRGLSPVAVVRPIPEAKSIDPEQAVTIAATRYPEGRLNSISVPADAEGVYQIGRLDVPGLSQFWSERIVSINQYSGEILDVRAPDTRRSAGEAFLDWQWPLHSGKAFGWPGRLLVFVSGLACPIIYASGVLMWWRKRRTR